MTFDMTQKCAAWRKDVDRMYERGRFTEKLAVELGLSHFDVRAQWGEPTLDNCEHGEELQEFAARVEATAKLLGSPPDKCDAQNWLGQYADDQAPDLVAEWKLEQKFEGVAVRVIVRNLSPRGCKVDPRTSFVEKQEQELHPECKAVLSELEDIEI